MKVPAGKVLLELGVHEGSLATARLSLAMDEGSKGTVSSLQISRGWRCRMEGTGEAGQSEAPGGAEAALEAPVVRQNLCQ